MTITLDRNYNTVTIANTQLKVSIDRVYNLNQVQEILEKLFYLSDPECHGVKIEEAWNNQVFTVAEWR